MGMDEHGFEVCVKRRNESAARYVANQIARGHEDAALQQLRYAENQGWLDELEQTMERMGLLKSTQDTPW